MSSHYAVEPEAVEKLVDLRMKDSSFQHLKGVLNDRIEFMRLMLTRATGDKKSAIERDILRSKTSLREMEKDRQ